LIELVLAAPVFAATLNVTVPLPVPLLPAVIEIHGALLVAVQLQADVALTETELLFVPDAGKYASFGATTTVHGVGTGVGVGVGMGSVGAGAGFPR
jgi:hypothetical protein